MPRSTFIHEAGHAVVKYVYGGWNLDLVRRFKEVSAEPDDQTAGRLSNHPEKWVGSEEDVTDLDYTDIGSWPARTRRKIEHRIMVCLAGAVAEDMYGFNDSDDTMPVEVSSGGVVDVYWGGSRSDFQAAWEYARLMGGSDETQGALLEWLRCRTRDFLNQPHIMTALERLADALEQQGSLSYGQASSVMDESLIKGA